MSAGIYPRARTNSRPIGDEMRDARERSGMTKKAVARQLYVTTHTVADWEAGRRHPAVEMLHAYLLVVGGTITLGVRR